MSFCANRYLACRTCTPPTVEWQRRSRESIDRTSRVRRVDRCAAVWRGHAHPIGAKMAAMKLSGIDANLLAALDALLREKSVTRAARRLGVGQPALSHSLSRLRDHF